MDIIIKAGQGRGKSTIAPQVAGLFKGSFREIGVYFGGSIFNKTAVKRAVINSNADVVLLDECADWFTPHVLDAVKDARLETGRDIVAIYCVLDTEAPRTFKQPDRIASFGGLDPTRTYEEIQLDRLKEKAVRAVKNGKTQEAREALEKFGAIRVSKLDPKHYDEYEQALDKINNESTGTD